MRICSRLCFSWSIIERLKVLLWTSCRKIQMLLLINKLTTIFHGLYSYRPQKRRQNVQNSSGTTSRRRVVSLQSFEHLDVISMFHTQTVIRVQTMENCCRFAFYNNIESFDIHFRWSFTENRAREKEKNKSRHHHIISTVCTVFEHSSRPISGREITQLW